MRRQAVIAATTVLLALPVHAQDISEEDAQLAYNNHCRQCHSTDEGDNRLGPSLYEVVGRKAGSLEGYQYSSSLESADFEWDAETLDKWISDPDSVVTGNKMKPYPGVAEEDIRKKIIAHLGG